MLETGHEKVARVIFEPARSDSTSGQPDPGPRDITFTEFVLSHIKFEDHCGNDQCFCKQMSVRDRNRVEDSATRLDS